MYTFYVTRNIVPVNVCVEVKMAYMSKQELTLLVSIEQRFVTDG